MAQIVSTSLPVRTTTSRLVSFAVHASLLGGFVGLVTFVAIACHHVH
jgi:hypothetical protein